MDELVLLLLDAGSGKCTTEVTEGSVYVLQVVFLLDARGSTSYSSNCVRVEHTDFGKEQSVSLAGCWTWDVGPMHLPLAQPSLLEERRKLDLPTRGRGGSRWDRSRASTTSGTRFYLANQVQTDMTCGKTRSAQSRTEE